ncbi:MAG: FKBP-type peptidyl-prolyl cis-trans isomerase [Vicinamibacteria bacterium]
MNRFLSAVVVFSMIGSGCSSDDSPTGPEAPLATQELTLGTGATAVAGDVLTVHYIGSLQNGTVFESSYRLGQPYQFRLGVGQVIPGWDQGIPGMKVGGKRRLIIPPSLAYGRDGSGTAIPPNATLQFDVELVAIAGK